MDTLSLTKEARFYNEEKTISLKSGAGKTGQPLVKEIVFTPLYILASFVKDKVSIGVWIYLWAFYFVPLIYVSVKLPTTFFTELEQIISRFVWKYKKP